MEGHAAETRAKEITQRERARRDKIKKSEELNQSIIRGREFDTPRLKQINLFKKRSRRKNSRMKKK